MAKYTKEERLGFLNSRIEQLKKQKSQLEKRQMAEAKKFRTHTLIELAAKTYGKDWLEASKIILGNQIQVDVFVNGTRIEELYPKSIRESDL